MATCLKDGTELGDEFGMATCPACNTVYFIDADGEVSISSEPVQLDSNFDLGTPIDIDIDVDINVASDGPQESPIEFQMDDQLEASSESQNFAPVNLDGGEFEMPTAPLEAVPPGPTSDPSDPLGIRDYIQSEISQAKDGPLLFRVFVSGIDSKEIRQSLREAISDSRFGWDADEIVGRVQKGELRLDDVSPVKASILVNRIKRLPVHIRWEQYDIKDAQI